MAKNNIITKMADADILRNKSALIPSAQSCRLSHSGTGHATALEQRFHDIVKDKRLSLTDSAVIELLFFYGLRISEVLRIKQYDIKSTGHILIKGLKGSNDRLIQPKYYYEFWLNGAYGFLPLGDTYSRFYYYRLFRRLGIGQKFNGNTNTSVTHYFRHNLVILLKKQGVSEDLLSNYIGHVSKKTLKYYVNK
jgi:integrase